MNQTLTDDQENIFVDAVGRTIFNSKKKRIDNDVEFTHFNTPLSPTVFGFANNAFFVGWAGRDKPEKGTRVMFNVAQLIASDNELNNKVFIAMMGCDAPNHSTYQTVRHVIHYKKDVTDVTKHFSACMMHVLPSTVLAEAQPQVLLEAQSQGCITVGTKVGDIQNMILRVLNDPNLIISVESEGIMADNILYVIRSYYQKFANQPEQFHQIRTRIVEKFMKTGHIDKMAYNYAKLISR